MSDAGSPDDVTTSGGEILDSTAAAPAARNPGKALPDAWNEAPAADCTSHGQPIGAARGHREPFFVVGMASAVAADILAWLVMAVAVQKDSTWVRFTESFGSVQLVWLVPLMIGLRHRRRIAGVVVVLLGTGLLSILGFFGSPLVPSHRISPQWIPWGLRDDGAFAHWREVLGRASSPTGVACLVESVAQWPVPELRDGPCRFEAYDREALVLVDALGRDKLMIRRWRGQEGGLIALEAPWVVVWRSREEGLVARWYDCDDLPPLDSRREAYGRVLGGEFATSAGKPQLSVTVPVTTTLGRSALDFEGGARHLTPVAIWWLNGRDIRWQEAVLLLDPGSSSCTIVCPAILRCDESHGVERIVYDSETRRVFGDGCRLRPFVLNEDFSEIEAWLSSGR